MIVVSRDQVLLVQQEGVHAHCEEAVFFGQNRLAVSACLRLINHLQDGIIDVGNSQRCQLSPAATCGGVAFDRVTRATETKSGQDGVKAVELVCSDSALPDVFFQSICDFADFLVTDLIRERQLIVAT